jgi:hypothetical protein
MGFATSFEVLDSLSSEAVDEERPFCSQQIGSYVRELYSYCVRLTHRTLDSKNISGDRFKRDARIDYDE